MSAIDKLMRSQQAAAMMAKEQLAKFWRLYGNLPPDELRDALLTFMPALGERYGDLAAAAAADWYEETKLAATGKRGNVVLANVDSEALVQATRWAVDDLYHGNPTDTWRKLEASLLRHVKNTGRGTVQRSAERDGIAFARVPSGAKTCAFCTMLASRGFVYGSAEAAGSIDRYHDDCDCQQIPEFAMNATERAEYDARVSEMYQEYQAAVGEVGSSDESAILSTMRKQNPGRYTDSPVQRPTFAPDHTTWRHILTGDDHGGGHAYGALVPGKSQFPEAWSKQDIEEAARAVVAQGRRYEQRTGEKYEGLVGDVVVRVVYVDGKVISVYPLRGVGVTRVVDGERVGIPLQSRDRRRYNLEHD